VREAKPDQQHNVMDNRDWNQNIGHNQQGNKVSRRCLIEIISRQGRRRRNDIRLVV